MEKQKSVSEKLVEYLWDKEGDVFDEIDDYEHFFSPIISGEKIIYALTWRGYRANMPHNLNVPIYRIYRSKKSINGNYVCRIWSENQHQIYDEDKCYFDIKDDEIIIQSSDKDY